MAKLQGRYHDSGTWHYSHRVSREAFDLGTPSRLDSYTLALGDGFMIGVSADRSIKAS